MIPFTQETRTELAHKAGRLALYAANDVPGAADRAREIMERLRSDRRVVA
jgi:hypothetical protein